MISLSGLAVAVGMLVDNSVVVIENIYRLRSKGANVIQAAVSGAGQVAGAVTASTLTTVCVFLPIVFVEGITRQLFTDLALTMSYALLASLIVSLTLVPAMASGLLRKDRPIREGFLEKYLLPLYRKAIRWVLGHKAVVLIAAAALLAVTAFSSLSKGFTFMPKMDMPSVNVSVTMPEGVDMEEASALADQVLERIAKVEGIDTVGAMMSVGTTSIGGMSQESYDVTVYVNLSDENGSGDAVGRQIVEACADLDCTVTASSSMMDMSMLTGSGISMNIYADDMEVLQSAAVRAAEVLEGIQGVAEVSNGLEDAAPALHIAIDRNAAMKNGLTVAQIYMEIASGLTADSTVASLELDGISTDVIIEKPEGAVLDARELRDYVFEVTDKEGNVKEVPLSDFAVVEETTSLSAINRLGQRRYLSVSAELEEGYNVTLLTAQAETAMKDTDLGDGVTYTFTGENETIMESVKQLGLMLLLGVLLVYLVMVAQFQSLKSPFIVMFTIPLAFTGGFLALLLCGMEVSVISLIGFVMLTGIIVNNGIVLVDYINQLRLDGMERREAIIEAGITRMRPILMTTTTTVLGLLDMAVRKSAGTALMKPIAVVCIGGLVYATLMTLFVVPCIYDLLNKKELRNVREEDLKMLDL
ncbi:MAG: efflux RND transporter permease subunit, partial [Evtepia sp.]